jgi:hypothetical protein
MPLSTCDSLLFHNRFYTSLCTQTLSTTNSNHVLSAFISVLRKAAPWPCGSRAASTTTWTGFMGYSCFICVLALCLGTSVLASVIHTSPSHATAWLPQPNSCFLNSSWTLIAIIAALCSTVATASKGFALSCERTTRANWSSSCLSKLHNTQTTLAAYISMPPRKVQLPAALATSRAAAGTSQASSCSSAIHHTVAQKQQPATAKKFVPCAVR